MYYWSDELDLWPVKIKVCFEWGQNLSFLVINSILRSSMLPQDHYWLGPNLESFIKVTISGANDQKLIAEEDFLP
jgi:hypothetical protein